MKWILFPILVLVVVMVTSPADAQDVSAHGSGVVAGLSCNFAELDPAEQCDAGGSGARYNVGFRGEALDPTQAVVPATGTFSVVYPDTGLKVEFVTGTALILRNTHTLVVIGTCQTRNAAGQLVPFGTGSCDLFAQDRTPNGATDQVSLFVFGTTGFVSACCEPASGNVNVD